MTYRFPRHVLRASLLALTLSSGVTVALAGSKSTTTRTSFDDRGGGFSYFFISTSSDGESDDLAYALIDPSQPDVDLISVRDGRSTVERLLSRSKSPLMWFRRDRKSYVVTDAALVAEGRELCEPMLWLGQSQGLVSKSQGELGSEKARSGQKLGELAERLGELSLRTVGARRSGDDVTELLRQRRAIEQERHHLLKDQAYLSREGESLGQRQHDLGEKQTKVVKQIGTAIERLFEDARAQGKAEPTKRR